MYRCRAGYLILVLCRMYDIRVRRTLEDQYHLLISYNPSLHP